MAVLRQVDGEGTRRDHHRGDAFHPRAVIFLHILGGVVGVGRLERFHRGVEDSFAARGDELDVRVNLMGLPSFAFLRRGLVALHRGVEALALDLVFAVGSVGVELLQIVERRREQRVERGVISTMVEAILNHGRRTTRFGMKGKDEKERKNRPVPTACDSVRT